MLNIAIYRRHLLAPAEGFIPSQAESLAEFTPYYFGLRRVAGPELPRERVFTVSKGGALGRIREQLNGAAAIAAAARRLDPVLVHAHFGPDAVIGLKVARELRIPLVITFHGYDVTTKREYALKGSRQLREYIHNIRDVQQHSACFIAVSEFVGCKLLEQGYPPDKVVVHYIGVDCDLFNCLSAIERQAYVLFVGRLVENKGCDYLIRAMAKVQRTVPGAKLLIAGDGPCRRTLQSLATSLSVNADFLGFRSAADIRELMTRATVFSVPSVTVASGASEGFGLVFLEAQAIGLPVVSFATGGIPEAVEHGVTGLLAAERDEQMLVEYLTLLLREPGIWKRLSVAARERVRNHFNLRKQTASLERIYHDVLRENGHRFSATSASVASSLVH